MSTTTTTPDFFRMSGKRLRWFATKGPFVTRPDAQAELDRRSAKKAAPAPAKKAAPAKVATPTPAGVTRMGEDFAHQAWALVPVHVARDLWASMNTADTYALTH